MRAVEELLFLGYPAKEIQILLWDRFNASVATIRGDLSKIRAQHRDFALENAPEAREQFIGRLHQLRRSAMAGYEDSNGKTHGRDYRLAYEIDKDISKALGYQIEADKKITVTLEAAQSYMVHVCNLIVECVRDPEDRARLLARIEAEAGIAAAKAVE